MPPPSPAAFERLRHACALGQLSVAKTILAELIPRTTFIPRVLVRSNNNSILRCTLIRGHTDVADWLLDEFKLGADDIRADCGFVMRTIRTEHRVAAFRGPFGDWVKAPLSEPHSRTLVWLASRFTGEGEDFFPAVRAICEWRP